MFVVFDSICVHFLHFRILIGQQKLNIQLIVQDQTCLILNSALFVNAKKNQFKAKDSEIKK